MENIETKLQRYRESIPYNETTEAFKTYYETKDKKIRENLILRYMQNARKIVLKYDITTIEKEDLKQIAYETLINCIDNYDLFLQDNFIEYLTCEIDKKTKELNDEMQKVSMSDIEIYTSNHFEENIINKIYNEGLTRIVDELLEKYHNPEHAKIFKKIHLNEYANIREILQKENISRPTLKQIEKNVAVYIYINLPKKYQYYPSEVIENLIIDPYLVFLYNASKKTKKTLEKIDIRELESIHFYDPNINTVYSDTNIIKEKTKKLEYK